MPHVSWHRRSPEIGAAIALALIAGSIVSLLFWPGSHQAAIPAARIPPTLKKACGVKSPPKHVEHVIWIWFENTAYDEVVGPRGSKAQADHPFMNSLAKACASATSMSSLQHASLGNYIAAATGSAAGIHGGCDPSVCPITRTSVFEQLTQRDRSWRSFQESMPSACLGRDSGRYAVRHDPIPYLTGISRLCATADLPLGTLRSGAFVQDLDHAMLPALTNVTPDLCEDGHDCPSSQGDVWLSKWLPRITSSAAYAKGDVAIFVMWDEGNRKRAPGVRPNAPCPSTYLRPDCHVPMFVIAPSIPSGTRIKERIDHVTVLQATETLLGLPLLGTDSNPNAILAATHVSQPLATPS